VASVAICAYATNRWDDLKTAVASVVGQMGDDDECVVVVDHNDQLLALAETEFASGGPAAGRAVIRVIPNAAERGLSGARNTAIAESRGEIIAFLDDDAAAGDGWLRRMMAELAQAGVFGVGTAANPDWPAGERPGWFPPEFDWVVGCSYRGLPTEPADVRNVFGVAMAFRREVFALAGMFSTDVGRIGQTPTGCEETELCIRLRLVRPDVMIKYLPDVAVTHRVTMPRVRPGYFLRRCLGEGRSKARVSRLVGADQALTSERIYVRSVLPRAFVRELGRFVGGNFDGLAAATMMMLGLLMAGGGYVVERAIGRDSV
jgi:glycosyltransferase involved in cell wall biosynthesis